VLSCAFNSTGYYFALFKSSRFSNFTLFSSELKARAFQNDQTMDSGFIYASWDKIGEIGAKSIKKEEKKKAFYSMKTKENREKQAHFQNILLNMPDHTLSISHKTKRKIFKY
jgi:hypothetical protein